MPCYVCRRQVDELKEEFSAERKRMEGEIRVLHSNLQALQIDHTEVLVEKAMVEAVLTMTRKGKQELQDQILREEHQHSQRIFELSRTVESLATGAAEANRVAIERELSNEALQVRGKRLQGRRHGRAVPAWEVAHPDRGETQTLTPFVRR